MMRLAASTALWMAAALFSVYGCKGESPTAAEPTTGGETTAEASLPSGGTSAAGAASPWGATRAEQCRRPARAAIDSKAKKPFDEGVRAAAANDAAKARTSFEQALKRDPNAYPALYNLGVLADRAGNEGEAIDFYRRALRIVPDYEAAARGLTTIQIRRGQLQGAVAMLEPLANEHRANLEIQVLYAELLVEAKRFDEAWMAARRALQCDERFVPALVALVKASRAQGRDELADSILEQAMQIDPRVAELHYLRGQKLQSEPGGLREAMAAYERAVELRPDYAEARMALGIQHLAGGNYPAALSHFQAAERVVPTLPAVHVNLGDAYRANKKWAEAQHAYRRALELQPKLPEAHYGLGLLFFTAGGDFPGVDEVTAYEKAVSELKTYRDQMGPRLTKDDQSGEYLRDLERMIKRARQRIEREQGGTS
jgi:tetratricopeptide (TPR) repeat protein